MSSYEITPLLPSFKKISGVSMAALCSVFILTGCELANSYTKQDREKGMEFQDYRDALAPRLPEVDTADLNDQNDIPPLKPYVSSPDGNLRSMPIVSVSLNQTVPLKDALYEIAEQAEYDVEIDPRIRGSIIFTARNKPLDVVMERISDIAGLRYKMEEDFMRIELDTPYHKIYRINYLNIIRENSGSVGNDISVVSGEGGDTGSNFRANNTSKSDFWAELNGNLTQILESNRDANRLLSSRTPQVTAVTAVDQGQIQPVLITEGDVTTGEGAEVQVQAPNVQLQVGVMDDEEDTETTPTNDPFAARFSINQQAGVVSVFAPQRLHKQVADYLNEIEQSVSSQVLIEAKVLEVTLDDRFAAGIDWSQAFSGAKGVIGFDTPGALVRGVIDPLPTPNSNFNASFDFGDIQPVVDAISRFGTVSALSSPRLTVLNNQTAVMNVAENVVYFEIESELETGDVGGPQRTFSTTAKTIPEGVLINVQPSVDRDRQVISLALRPTVTTVTDFVEDPNPDLALAGVISLVPQVNVQEIDSVVNLNNGQAIIMGGLMQDKTTAGQGGVPIVSEIPIFGSLFKNKSDEIEKTELVILLKATIVEGGNTVHNTDKDLYREFSRDRRPFKL